MAQLHFFYASMNAGKSTHLLQANYNYVQGGMRTLLLTSSLDDRFGENRISSRLGVAADALGVAPGDDIMVIFRQQWETHKIDCVMVDESQFLTEAQVLALSDIVDHYEVPVMCYGLRNDFLGKPFEGSQVLMAIADALTAITSVCFCGKPATMVVRTDGEHRVIKGGDQVAIEDTGDQSGVRYHSVCRRHFKEAIQTDIYPHPIRPDLLTEGKPLADKDHQAKGLPCSC